MNLTRAERSGALMVLGLFVLGAAWDLWQIHRPPPRWSPVAPRAENAPSPSVERPSPAPATVSIPAGRPESNTVSNRIDLNRADARELDQLPGIGPVLAGRIVEHRRLAGPYRTVEELLAVRGIGPALLERLRDRVRTDSLPGELHDRGASHP